MANQNHEQENQDTMRRQPTFAPRVDVYENEQEYLLLADLPGIGQEELSLSTHDDELTIEGRPEAKEPTAGYTPARYRRSFDLPTDVDRDQIDAELSAGVLRLRLPKAAAYQPRKISVRSN